MMQPILLAAGRSACFGSDKLLHPLADGTMPCDDPGVLQDIDLPEHLPMPPR